MDGKIRIARVERSAGGGIPIALSRRAVESKQNEAGLMVGLIERVHMRPLAKIAQVADIAWRRVKGVGRRLESILDGEPLIVVRQVVEARRGRVELLVQKH